MMTPLERARLIAEQAYHLAAADEIAEKLEIEKAAEANVGIELEQFDPAWKNGIRLSKLGREKILAAYDRRIKQTEVAKLFRISVAAANHWYSTWSTRRQR
jgi:hypothetical protein